MRELLVVLITIVSFELIISAPLPKELKNQQGAERPLQLKVNINVYTILTYEDGSNATWVNNNKITTKFFDTSDSNKERCHQPQNILGLTCDDPDCPHCHKIVYGKSTVMNISDIPQKMEAP